jgi:hypothetical protein
MIKRQEYNYLLELAKLNYTNGEVVTPLYGSFAYLTITDIDNCFLSKNPDGISVCVKVKELVDTGDNTVAIYGNGKWTKDIYSVSDKDYNYLVEYLNELEIV